MNPGNNISASMAGPGEGHEGETPQVSRSYSKTFLVAQGTWVKAATAKLTFMFLDTAKSHGINRNDINNFMLNQLRIRKVKANDKHNENLCRKHSNISNNLMSLKVADQALVVDEATANR